MSERVSIISDGWGEGFSNGVEGIRTGGVSQATGDWIDMVGVEV